MAPYCLFPRGAVSAITHATRSMKYHDLPGHDALARVLWVVESLVRWQKKSRDPRSNEYEYDSPHSYRERPLARCVN